MSPSFVRFGTFQLPALRGGDQLELVRKLADYIIRHHYSHLSGEGAGSLLYGERAQSDAPTGCQGYLSLASFSPDLIFCQQAFVSSGPVQHLDQYMHIALEASFL